jgi:hypothetical protein
MLISLYAMPPTAAAAPVAAIPIAPTLLAIPEKAELMPEPIDDIEVLSEFADFFDRSIPRTKSEAFRVSLVEMPAIFSIQ